MTKLTAEQLDIINQAISILDQTIINRKIELTSPSLVRNYLRLKLEKKEREFFAVIFLDNKHKVIEYNEMFSGTIGSAAVYPREILKRALELNSSAILIAHNHPSGDAEESHADKMMTDRIKEVLDIVDIRLLDHIIIGSGEMVSFAEKGFI